MKCSYLLGLIGLCLMANAADKAGKIDLKDPSIWQEQKQPDGNRQDPCEVLQSSACPGYLDKKTDIQKEQMRREDNRRYKSMESGKPYYPS